MKTAITLLALLGLASCTGPAPLYTITRTVSPPPASSAKPGFAPDDITGKTVTIDRSREETIRRRNENSDTYWNYFDRDLKRIKPHAPWQKTGKPGTKTEESFPYGHMDSIRYAITAPNNKHPNDSGPISSETTYRKTGANTAEITSGYRNNMLDMPGPATYELVFTSPGKGYIKPYIAWGGIDPYAVRNLTFSLKQDTAPIDRLRTALASTSTITTAHIIPNFRMEGREGHGEATFSHEDTQTIKNILSRMQPRQPQNADYRTDTMWKLNLYDLQGRQLHSIRISDIEPTGNLQCADENDRSTLERIVRKRLPWKP